MGSPEREDVPGAVEFARRLAVAMEDLPPYPMDVTVHGEQPPREPFLDPRDEARQDLVRSVVALGLTVVRKRDQPTADDLGVMDMHRGYVVALLALATELDILEPGAAERVLEGLASRLAAMAQP